MPTQRPAESQRSRTDTPIEAPSQGGAARLAPEPDAAPLTRWQALATVLTGSVLIVLIGIFIRYTELVSGQYVSTGVPPLPAFTVLLLLAAIGPALQRRFPRLVPTRAQRLLLYAMLTVAVVLSGLYHIRAFLPSLVSLSYWSREGSPLARHFAGYADYLPAWYAPRDMEAIRRYYEGSRDGSIPWNVWLVPLAFWSLFFLAMFVGVFSLVTLLRRQWTQNERLSFPLTTLPLALTAPNWSAYGSPAARRALFLFGFGIATLFSGINILHAFYPSAPRIGFQVSLREVTLDRPWTPLRAITLYMMLDAIGIGYFVPLDLSFSVWFFYLVNRALAVMGVAAGSDEPGFPFTQEQSAGGYLVIGLFLLWRLRRPLAESFARAWRRSESGEEVWAERWAWMGLCGSSIFILGFCRAAGLSYAISLPFFGVIALFTLVYARARAETGIPFQFIHPWTLPKELTLNFLSVPQALAWGGVGSMVILSSLAWISSNHHPMEQAAYQFDSAKLASDARIPYRTLFLALLVAFVVGLLTAYWAHLSAYYAQGSNLIPSAGGIGEARETQARQSYEQMASQITALPSRSVSRLMAVGGGGLAVGALLWLRNIWHGSPFHPLGFVIATAFGDTSTCWFPLFVAWLAKFTILRYGGLRLFRQGIPFFLGLTIGHFLVGGVAWPLMGQFISKEAANSYHLLFGE